MFGKGLLKQRGIATLRQEPTEFTEWWTLLSKQKYHSTECLEPVQPSTHGSPGLFKNTPFWFLRKPVQLTRFFYYFISSFFFFICFYLLVSTDLPVPDGITYIVPKWFYLCGLGKTVTHVFLAALDCSFVPPVTSTQILGPDPVPFDFVDVVLAIWARKDQSCYGCYFLLFCRFGWICHPPLFCYIKLVAIVFFKVTLL